MHIAGADLNLERLALRADHGRVQRLIHPEPGLGDVVLEPARHGLPERMYDADGGVAVADLIAENPDPDQIVDVIKIAALDDHLLIN